MHLDPFPGSQQGEQPYHGHQMALAMGIRKNKTLERHTTLRERLNPEEV